MDIQTANDNIKAYQNIVNHACALQLVGSLGLDAISLITNILKQQNRHFDKELITTDLHGISCHAVSLLEEKKRLQHIAKSSMQEAKDYLKNREGKV